MKITTIADNTTNTNKPTAQIVSWWGYCLGVAGGQGKRAPIEKGLQAHTCYHYTGSILEDQGFDSELIKNGKFVISYFDVCMSVPSLEVGANLTLSQCSDTDTQKFELNAKSQLVSQSQPNLCVTVNSTQKKQGRGGSPVHVMRPVSLQTCEDSSQNYQKWSLYSLCAETGVTLPRLN